MALRDGTCGVPARVCDQTMEQYTRMRRETMNKRTISASDISEIIRISRKFSGEKFDSSLTGHRQAHVPRIHPGPSPTNLSNTG